MGKNVDVLLKEDVLKLGSMGDIVNVKPGYARNYLLPQGLAVLANTAAKRQIEKLRERAAEVEAADRENLSESSRYSSSSTDCAVCPTHRRYSHKDTSLNACQRVRCAPVAAGMPAELMARSSATALEC